ncbi:unnamed protein product [Boreogadus saida]
MHFIDLLSALNGPKSTVLLVTVEQCLFSALENPAAHKSRLKEKQFEAGPWRCSIDFTRRASLGQSARPSDVCQAGAGLDWPEFTNRSPPARSVICSARSPASSINPRSVEPGPLPVLLEMARYSPPACPLICYETEAGRIDPAPFDSQHYSLDLSHRAHPQVKVERTQRGLALHANYT